MRRYPASVLDQPRSSLVLPAIVVAVVLAAVGGLVWYLVYHANDPTHGTVYGRHYRPAYTSMVPVSHCAGYNSKGSCTVHVTVYVPDFHPAEYELCFRRDPDDTGHNPTACVDVDAVTWDRRYPVGSRYP